MAIIVEHDKRKREILEKAMELFCRDGYEDVTFQKIADACGITRTTLYIYFKNKHEIFNFSIKQASDDMEVKIMEVIGNKELTPEECLRKVSCLVIDICAENAQLFKVLIPYLGSLHKTGVDVDERIRRRTIRITHILSMIVIRGQKSGSFKDANVKDMNELILNIIENFVFRLSVLHSDDVEASKACVNLAIDGLLNN